MTDLWTSCPTRERIRELIDGLLSDDERLSTQSHVDGCTACQQTLESLVAGGASWDAAVHHLKNDSTPPEQTVLSDAIERLKADPFVESAAHASASVNPLDFLTPSDQPGSIGKLGTYEVIEVIGQGGMGIVLKAFDPALHRVVAVKILAPYLAHSPQARKRFIREAQAIAAVTHEHVITIHSIDESAEQPRIIMQYVPGHSLQHKLDVEGSLDLKEILRIGMQTASGLAAAHAQGLVHRDVKPSNILLENGIQRVKLTDFGLARAVDDASLTQSGVIAGTPQYMAPEQANGDAVDYRADLFSLGSVLYAMCVGHSPFRASTTMGVLKRVCHDPPRPIQELNPDIPNWLCAIVIKLLEKQPEDRFPSAKVVAELLEKWLAHVQQPQVTPKPQQTVDSIELKPKRGKVEIVEPDWLSRYLDWPHLPSVVALIVAFIAQSVRPSPIGVTVLAAAAWFGTKSLCSRRRLKFASGISGTQDQGVKDISSNASAENPFQTAESSTYSFPWWVLVVVLIGLIAVRDEPLARGEVYAVTVCGTVGLSLLILIRSIRTRRFFPFKTGLWLSIGWYIAGVFDLVLSMIVIFDRVAPIWMPLTWLGMSIASFVASHCIYVRQNPLLVRWMSELGLLPVSFGAFVRIPISIVTLKWQSYPATRETFENTPWPDTKLGRLVNIYKRFLFWNG